ncbi:MAG: hypothetical protein EPN98_19860, partial [Phenylobacterium sp.]
MAVGRGGPTHADHGERTLGRGVGPAHPAGRRGGRGAERRLRGAGRHHHHRHERRGPGPGDPNEGRQLRRGDGRLSRPDRAA